MIVRSLLGAWIGASVLALTGCGGADGGGGIPVAEKATDAASVPAAGASLAVQPTVSREPVVIEQKVSTGDHADISALRPRQTGDAPVPAQIRLPAPPPEALELQKSGSAAPGAIGQIGSPIKIGVGRKVSDSATAQRVSSLLGWSPSSVADVKMAALRFVSPGALGVRAGLRVDSLPLGSLVRFYADGSDQAYEVSAQEILATIQRNLDAGDSSDAARTYWSPNLGGEAITVEVQIPKASSVDSVKVSVPAISHVTVDIRKLDSIAKVAGSCNVDVSCTTTYNELSKSVALMDFTESDGNDYVCTGTLMNDRMSSGTPYLLSANHCISNQTVASTLITLWNFKSASCNSTQVSASLAVSTRIGATLLYQSADTDTSFMQLAGSPPVGAVYAGSSAFGLDYSDAVYGVSHSKGDLQKYARGNYMGMGACNSGGCFSSSASTASFLRVSWFQGMTETGSSGSGLFTKLNGKDYLVGQLFGGYASCENPFGNEYYGRFDKAYAAALYQWLGATSGTIRQPIYRLFNRQTSTHFFTTNPAERDRAVEKSGVYLYEGVAFYAYSAPGIANDTVYRFFNTRTGVHFYTINPGERDQVIRTMPWLVYEGAAWSAGAGPLSQSSPMYRFFNTTSATHFYTINLTERDNIIRTQPKYNYEGVGYYAWLAP